MLGLVVFFQAEDGIRDYKVTGVQTCALPICRARHRTRPSRATGDASQHGPGPRRAPPPQRNGAQGWARQADGRGADRDRKSTRLNSSHLVISYAVFCLKKKKKQEKIIKI